MNFQTLIVTGFLFGIGFGFFVQRSGLCFAQGLGEIFIGKGKRILRLFLIIFVISSMGFLLSGYIDADLGLKPIGELRGAGFYNLLSGILFGSGIFLCGGCILGTLRQMGEGNLNFLIVFFSFIPGMALVVYVINPVLEKGYDIQKILLPELMGIPAPYVTGLLFFGALSLLWKIRRHKK